jgi:hypothetical protein
MQDIKPGDQVRALTATKQWIPLRATTAVTDGVDFPVVWLCSDEEWANLDDDDRSVIPWPAEAVEVVRNGGDA